MGIIKHVENLRQKPAHERRRYAALYSGGITAVIFVVWLSVLLPGSRAATIAQNDAADTPSLKDGLSQVYNEATEGYVEIRQGIDAMSADMNQAAAAAALSQDAASSTEETDPDRVWDAPVSSDGEYDFGD